MFWLLGYCNAFLEAEARLEGRTGSPTAEMKLLRSAFDTEVGQRSFLVRLLLEDDWQILLKDEAMADAWTEWLAGSASIQYVLKFESNMVTKAELERRDSSEAGKALKAQKQRQKRQRQRRREGGRTAAGVRQDEEHRRAMESKRDEAEGGTGAVASQERPETPPYGSLTGDWDDEDYWLAVELGMPVIGEIKETREEKAARIVREEKAREDSKFQREMRAERARSFREKKQGERRESAAIRGKMRKQKRRFQHLD
jgi:hypothetical protein